MLKEQILDVLLSNERSVKVLANVLQINPVRVLVSNYEECHGQVSLDTWKYVLHQLGYPKEHFQQLVLADQMIADVTDIAGIDDLEENNCGAQSIPRNSQLPESLSPPDETLVEENVVEDAAKGDDDQDSSMEAAAEKGSSLENNKFSSTVQSLSQGNSSILGLVSVVENGRSQHANSALAVIEERDENSSLQLQIQADYQQQSIDETTTPSRPTTPEAPGSTNDPVVTGQERSRQNNAGAEAEAEADPPGNGEEENSDQESGSPYKTPTENDCIAENDFMENNNGLYAELQKVVKNFVNKCKRK